MGTPNICQHKALWFTKSFLHIASRLLLALGKQAWQLLLLSCTDEDTEPTIPQDSDPLMDRDKARDEDRRVAVLWPWCREVTSLWGSLAGWSSSPPHSHFVNVFISRKDADRHKEKRNREERGEKGPGCGESTGEVGRRGRGPSRVTTSRGSHSLSAPIPDRWRVGESWCQEAVTTGEQSWGEGALWGEGSSWWSGCWVFLEPALRGPWLGAGMNAVGQESGQGVSPPPAWDWLPLPSPHPAASRTLPPKTPPTHPSLGIGGRQELWRLTLTCGQDGPE